MNNEHPRGGGRSEPLPVGVPPLKKKQKHQFDFILGNQIGALSILLALFIRQRSDVMRDHISTGIA